MTTGLAGSGRIMNSTFSMRAAANRSLSQKTTMSTLMPMTTSTVPHLAPTVVSGWAAGHSSFMASTHTVVRVTNASCSCAAKRARNRSVRMQFAHLAPTGTRTVLFARAAGDHSGMEHSSSGQMARHVTLTATRHGLSILGAERLVGYLAQITHHQRTVIHGHAVTKCVCIHCWVIVS